MRQKHENVREIRTPFPPRDIRKNPRSMYVRESQSDGAIFSKNRKIVPYHGDSPNTRNGVRLRSLSPIIAPVWTKYAVPRQIKPGSQSNLPIVFIFVSCEEKGYYRVVSVCDS